MLGYHRSREHTAKFRMYILQLTEYKGDRLPISWIDKGRNIIESGPSILRDLDGQGERECFIVTREC